MALLVGFSRVAAGVHYVHDIASGLALGVLVVTLVTTVPRPAVDRLPASLTVCPPPRLRPAGAGETARVEAGAGMVLPHSLTRDPVHPADRVRPADRVHRFDQPDPVHLGGRSRRFDQLAAAAGLSEGRAARRLTALLASGAVYLQVDLAASALGFSALAYVWLTVEPGRLDGACAALSAHAETPYVAAVSGRSNIMIAVTTRSLADLYGPTSLSSMIERWN
jgi:DNA-binding Lrp family transcriptional regulator